jgi:hypothetical protein
MAKHQDKQGRKESLAKWKADQQATAQAALPLTADRMKALFDMLDLELPKQDCDHTLRITGNWLQAHGLPVDSVVTWLKANGGFCDCEALANAEEAWQRATGQSE